MPRSIRLALSFAIFLPVTASATVVYGFGGVALGTATAAVATLTGPAPMNQSGGGTTQAASLPSAPLSLSTSANSTATDRATVAAIETASLAFTDASHGTMADHALTRSIISDAGCCGVFAYSTGGAAFYGFAVDVPTSLVVNYDVSVINPLLFSAVDPSATFSSSIDLTGIDSGGSVTTIASFSTTTSGSGIALNLVLQPGAYALNYFGKLTSGLEDIGFALAPDGRLVFTATSDLSSYDGNYTFALGDPLPPVIIPPGSAVSEPSSWALTIAGLGMIGLAPRRRAKRRATDALRRLAVKQATAFLPTGAVVAPRLAQRSVAIRSRAVAAAGASG